MVVSWVFPAPLSLGCDRVSLGHPSPKTPLSLFQGAFLLGYSCAAAALCASSGMFPSRLFCRLKTNALIPSVYYLTGFLNPWQQKLLYFCVASSEFILVCRFFIFVYIYFSIYIYVNKLLMLCIGSLIFRCSLVTSCFKV